MEPVIRPLCSVVLLLSLATSCAGADRVAVDAGNDGLTRAELIAVTRSLANIDSEEVIPAVSTDALNSNATAYLRSQAFLEYFEAERIDTSESRGEAQDVINDAITQGQIAELEFGSGEFEALVDIVTADIALSQNQLGTLATSFDDQFPDQWAIFETYASDFSVESRLGDWNTETYSVVSN